MSVTAWSLLDLEETQDVRSIKRAYAKAVRRSRPEEDPEHFQHLTHAYEWAIGYAAHRERERLAAEAGERPDEVDAAHQQDALAVADVAPAAIAAPAFVDAPAEPTGAPAATDDDGGVDADSETKAAADEGFHFNPFFEAMAGQISSKDPRRLREWLDSHPDLYSVELKWALIPHVFDTLAHNAAAIDPHRGHLDTLQAFFGVDATLRGHPAVAPAIDYLESRAWKQAAPDPGGWANIDAVMENRPPTPRKPVKEDLPWGWILAAVFVAAKVIAAIGAS